MFFFFSPDSEVQVRHHVISRWHGAFPRFDVSEWGADHVVVGRWKREPGTVLRQCHGVLPGFDVYHETILRRCHTESFENVRHGTRLQPETAVGGSHGVISRFDVHHEATVPQPHRQLTRFHVPDSQTVVPGFVISLSPGAKIILSRPLPYRSLSDILVHTRNLTFRHPKPVLPLGLHEQHLVGIRELRLRMTPDRTVESTRQQAELVQSHPNDWTGESRGRLRY